ncbi:glutamate receptor-interacting protein 2-like isoform X2 [Tachypleus tridentatus]|uniref:glutamate receptor-interacting protein 2-like isoform X2 n=1 Tax=Tachypleus tridentatus TaxID=6853 RepID=UPI003FD5387B
MRIFRKFFNAQGENDPNTERQYTSQDMMESDKPLYFTGEKKRGISKVELVKKEDATLGLTITGGIDKDSRPKISNLKPGSPAHRIDTLAVGDYLVSVNGIRTNNLRHGEIVNLLTQAEDKVTLEVEYENPLSTGGSVCVRPKVTHVKLKKENGSFGFTLRGGFSSDRLKSRPLTITHVQPGGPAYREGTIKAGDRLLAVENTNLGNASLQDTLVILKRLDQKAVFTLEYDVSIMDVVGNASGPVLVEIDKTPGTQLGVTLTQVQRPQSAIVIESIQQASVAERCGALNVGDHILAIDGTTTEHMTITEASQLLKNSLKDVVKLKVLPVNQVVSHKGSDGLTSRGFTPFSCVGQLGSRPTQNSLSSIGNNVFIPSRKALPVSLQPSIQGRLGRQLSKRKCPSSSLKTCSSSATWVPPRGQLSYTDTTKVTIQADLRGLGFSVKGSDFSTDLTSFPVIGRVEPGGPAERTGILQVGDRVVAVNGQSTQGLTVKEVTQLLHRSRPRVTLDIQFDVAEAVVPSSGTFAVKLAKSKGGLGITIAVPKNRQQGEPLLISDIKKGSVAHRTGTLQPGDTLLAIDSVRMDNCTLEDAYEILKVCDQIVKLRIRKDETFSEEPDVSGAVVYTVELVRHGGPLGITISGVEEPFNPIVISGLTEGGLAEKTRAIHVGDRLLAINGQSLRGKPLSEAILMLQNSGDIVTLKISKTPDQNRNEELKTGKEEPQQTEDRDDYLNNVRKTIPSVDSAVESWGSSDLEISITGARSKQVNQTSDSTVLTGSSVNQNFEPSGTDNNFQSRRWEDEDWELNTNSNHSFQSCGSCYSGEKGADWSEDSEDIESEFQGRCQSIMGSDPGYLAHSQSQLLHFHGELQPSCESVFRPVSRAVSMEQVCELVSQPGLQLTGQSDSESQRYSTLPHVTSRRGREQVHQSVDEAVSSCQSSSTASGPLEIHKVILFKDQVYEDFGFSVSDGLYERGIYINKIRPGGPASVNGILKPLDKILQVNNTRTQDFDCCLAVPLIAAAGDRIELVVSRSAYKSRISLADSTNGGGSTFHGWVDEEDRENCSSPQLPPDGGEMLTKTL